MNANYMNAGLVPTGGNHLEWLRKMGYDVGPMMHNFGLEQAGADIYGGQMQGIPGYTQEAMPGGTGWDGANAKMAYLAQNAMMARRQKKAMAAPSVPMGHPGGGPSYDIENRSRQASFGGGGTPFGMLARLIPNMGKMNFGGVPIGSIAR